MDKMGWGGDNTQPIACSAAWFYPVQVAPLLELVLCVSWIRWGGVGIIPNQSLAPLLILILYKLLRYLNLSCVCVMDKMGWGGDNTKPVACSAAYFDLVQVALLLELVLCVSWIRWGGVGIIPNQSLAPLLILILYKLLRYLNLSCVSWCNGVGKTIVVIWWQRPASTWLACDKKTCVANSVPFWSKTWGEMKMFHKNELFSDVFLHENCKILTTAWPFSELFLSPTLFFKKKQVETMPLCRLLFLHDAPLRQDALRDLRGVRGGQQLVAEEALRQLLSCLFWRRGGVWWPKSVTFLLQLFGSVCLYFGDL